MELQWPLIIFTTLVAWSAGLFGAQAALSLFDKGEKAQKPALASSLFLLAAGGIAVVFHLQHWERIFNGFGHITSGITQELIAIVVMVAIAVAYFFMLRRSVNGGTVPKWLAGCAIAIAVILVAVMAHSYMMPSRPAWNSLLEIGSLLGAALILGPLTMMLIVSITDTSNDINVATRMTLICSAAGTLLIAAYAITLQASGGSFVNVGFYLDPTHPTASMVDPLSAVNSIAALLWLGGVIAGGVLPTVCAAIAWKKPTLTKPLSGIGIACGLIGAICLRVAFYQVGLSVFIFY